MKIKIVYFGRPAELLQVSEEQADVPATVTSVAELMRWLHTRGAAWRKN